MKLSFGHLVPASLLVVALAWSGQAKAVPACTNDVDCPGTACGDQVCSWATVDHACVPAGTAAQGNDGWCTVDTDCKCMGQGATCVGVHCTFTLPDAGTSSADGGTTKDGGTVVGSDGGTSSGDGGGVADDAGGLGADSGASTTRPDSGATDGTDQATDGDSGGCSMGGVGTSSAPIFGVALLGLAGLFTRRRRAR